MDPTDLGERICILGQSASGKSTLAAALGQARGLPVVHLDQLRHVPGSRWVVRPDPEFETLHAAAVAEERWVIEGNYSRWLESRLERATGLILLEVSTPTSFLRNVHRSSTVERHPRVGDLGGGDTLTWERVRFIVGQSGAARRRRAAVFAQTDLPKVRLSGTRAIRDFCRRATA